jgi:hypothetical protein
MATAPPRHRRLLTGGAIVTVALVALAVWMLYSAWTPGWTGIVLAQPVAGQVEVRNAAGVVIDRLDEGEPNPVEVEPFRVGPGLYTVVVCAGDEVEGTQQAFSVLVLPGAHTTVWNVPRQYANAGVFQICVTNG